MSELFYTVFPNDENEMPQDFPSYEEAKEYGNKMFGEGNYSIEAPYSHNERRKQNEIC